MSVGCGPGKDWKTKWCSAEDSGTHNSEPFALHASIFDIMSVGDESDKSAYSKQWSSKRVSSLRSQSNWEFERRRY